MSEQVHESVAPGRVCGTCGKALETDAHWRRRFCDDRCRKAQYARPCLDCGKPLSGSDGFGPRAPVRCGKCAAVASGEARTVWTPDEVLTAIRRWAAVHGEPPRISNWCPTIARDIGHPELAAEYEAGEGYNQPGEWPHKSAVIRAFGTWNAAIRAAGFAARPAHHRPEHAKAA